MEGRSRRALASADDVWREIFRREGLDYEPADLRFYEGSPDGLCGEDDDDDGFAAFYCPFEQRIYLSRDAERTMDAVDWAYVVAHEVGHHVQELTVGRILSHRPAHELQADCYAGVWGGAVGLRLPAPTWYTDFEETHGSAGQQREWLQRGHESGRPGLCAAPLGARGR